MAKQKHHQSHAAHLRSVRLGRVIGARPKTMRAIAIIAVLVSAGYLTWRLTSTAEGINPWMFWPLWAAELIGWFSLALFVHDAWDQKPQIRDFEQVDGRFAIAIPTYNEDRNVLEPTIMAAVRVRGADSVWVLDDGHRKWVKQLAKHYGAKYLTRDNNAHAKAGNINNALEHIDAEFLLILDADHVAAADFLEQTRGYFCDPKVALVQTPHSFRNLDSFQHFDNEIHEQSLFFEVLLPGRQRNKAVFWCGSGGVLRLSALREIGGLATQTITEDLETSLTLNRAGYEVIYHNKALLSGLAPQNLGSFLLQRYRWARGTLEILLGKNSPIFHPKSSFRTRVSYFSNLIYYLVPLQHLMFAGVLVATLTTGQLPLNAGSGFLLFFWLPQLALTLFAIWGLSRGRQLPLGGSRNAWITSSIYIRALFDTVLRRKASFQVTPKSGTDTGGVPALALLWLPTLVTISLLLAMIIRQVSEFNGGFLPEMTFTGIWLANLFALFELAILIPLLISAFGRFQTRSTWRESVDIHGYVEGTAVHVVDLHEGGLKFLAAGEVVDQMKLGEKVNVLLHVTTEDGHEAQAAGRLLVSGKYVDPANALGSIGGPVTWKSDRDRRLIIEQCYLVAPVKESM